MPFIKVYLHFVWATKNREPYLESAELRKSMWKHIFENARSKGIYVDTVNGYNDHCHCLVSFGSNQTIEKVAQMIKGESSFWFNKQKLIKQKFGWQDEYLAVSVSESIIPKVREYILNQEIHHKKKKYQDEVDLFIQKYGFKEMKDL